MIWVVAIVIAVILFFMFKKNDTETTTVTQEKGYTDHLPDDFQFSSEHIQLLNELQLFCYEIARDNDYMKYANRSFEYQMMLELDVSTRLTSGEFIIQPGGDWDNDFDIFHSIKNKRCQSLIMRSFTDADSCLIYRSSSITGLYERLGLDKGVWDSAMKVGFQSIVNGWSSAHDNNKCEVVNAEFSDYSKTNGKIFMNIKYRYSYMG